MFKREKKVYLELTDKEYRLVRKYLMDWRNKLTAQGRNAEPVTELLVKLMANRPYLRLVLLYKIIRKTI